MWGHRKYITLNRFVGYKAFDLHYWPPQDRRFNDNSRRVAMVGVTLFYYRLELFLNWDHKGASWKA